MRATSRVGKPVPAFEHLYFWQTGDREQVIHDPEAVRPGTVGALGNQAEQLPPEVLSHGEGSKSALAVLISSVVLILALTG